MAEASKPPLVIAIDGPGASGKSTVGLLLAQRLGYRFVDTGSMYRALTWQALREGVSFDDEAALAQLAEATVLDVQPSTKDAQGAVLVEGQDVTPYLHNPEVDAKVSLLARIPEVRRVLVDAQRRMSERGGIVMVGRDIGEVVLPDADLKVYLDASTEERARRRYRDLQGEGVDYDEVLADLRMRDDLDSTREVSPLRPAPGAVNVDSSDLTPQQVVEYLLALGSK